MSRILLAVLLIVAAAILSQVGVVTGNLPLCLLAVLPMVGTVAVLLGGDR